MLFLRRHLRAIGYAAIALVICVELQFQPVRSLSSDNSTLSQTPALVDSTPTDWSRFAYAQYATGTIYLCNSLMLFKTLHELGVKADLLLLYAKEFDPIKNPTTREAELLIKCRDEYGVKLQPVEVQKHGEPGDTWTEVYTKLLIFNQTQYDRVLFLDSDSVVLKPMDELFLLPSSTIAMPRAYWMSSRNDHFLSAQLILIEPSIDELQRLLDAVKVAGEFEYDNHILNNLYGDSAIVLPHRPYNILTREFRNENEDHRKYLGSDKKEWDPEKELRDAKFLHFSDWPVTPKPWLGLTRRIEDTAPHCVDVDVEHDLDCKSQLLWLGFYNDYRTRRKEVCGAWSLPDEEKMRKKARPHV